MGTAGSVVGWSSPDAEAASTSGQGEGDERAEREVNESSSSDGWGASFNGSVDGSMDQSLDGSMDGLSEGSLDVSMEASSTMSDGDAGSGGSISDAGLGDLADCFDVPHDLCFSPGFEQVPIPFIPSAPDTIQHVLYV